MSSSLLVQLPVEDVPSEEGLEGDFLWVRSLASSSLPARASDEQRDHPRAARQAKVCKVLFIDKERVAIPGEVSWARGKWRRRGSDF